MARTDEEEECVYVENLRNMTEDLRRLRRKGMGGERSRRLIGRIVRRLAPAISYFRLTKSLSNPEAVKRAEKDFELMANGQSISDTGGNSVAQFARLLRQPPVADPPRPLPLTQGAVN